MTIFNSLGSNYDLKFALRAIFAPNDKKYKLKLLELLKSKYKGRAVLTYKGRDAIRLALRIIDRKNYNVGICGFTCYAVYKAVVDEGYKPVYLDIDESLNFSFETLKNVTKKNPQMKILIIQNTLGFPCEMEKISKFCRGNKIILIEDLAHSIGAKYFDGREAGLVGDFTVLSFSQDKMVDGVSGGALIVQSSKFKVQSSNFEKILINQQIRDRFYPSLTLLIRNMYRVGLGKLLHVILKKFDLLSKPIDSWFAARNDKIQSPDLYELPGWYCGLILQQFKNLDKDLTHRQKIASIYENHISKDILSSILDKQIDISSNLRFPIFVEKREELIKFLKQKNIFVSDIWYDAPIAPKKYLLLTDYKDQCPNAEEISEKMLNLATHRNVGEEDALLIAKAINEWVEKFSI